MTVIVGGPWRWSADTAVAWGILTVLLGAPLGLAIDAWPADVPRDDEPGTIPEDGITLGDPECWRVEPTGHAAAFFRALNAVTQPDAVLYLEDTIGRDVPLFLESRQVPNPIPVVRGTIFPRPDTYHVRATGQNLNDLADLIERNGDAPPAFHVVLYRERQVLVEWYDAFNDEPIHISAVIAESAVRTFAQALGCGYRWTRYRSGTGSS